MRDVVAALIGDHAEPALDQREVLAVLAEQRRGEAVVVEGEHDLRRRAALGRRAASRSFGFEACATHQAPAASASAALRCAGCAVPPSAPNRLLALDLGDRHRRDLADQRCRRHDLHRLQIGRAADDLAGMAARLSRTARRSVRPTQRRVERRLLARRSRPAAAAAARSSPLPAPDRPSRRPACRAAANI